MGQVYTPAAFEATAFNCPRCGAYAKQEWFDICLTQGNMSFGQRFNSGEHLMASKCSHCQRLALWEADRLILPNFGAVASPNADLSQEIKTDYEEARSIVNSSPRGAAALLRLGIQKLCKELGQPGKNINDDIASLVKAGLPVSVQKALDSVRVIGNEAVHPGSIDLRDDFQTATKLFMLVNFIADKMITEPKEIDGIYAGLPVSKREEIDKRAAKNSR